MSVVGKVPRSGDMLWSLAFEVGNDDVKSSISEPISAVIMGLKPMILIWKAGNELLSA